MGAGGHGTGRVKMGRGRVEIAGDGNGRVGREGGDGKGTSGDSRRWEWEGRKGGWRWEGDEWR